MAAKPILKWAGGKRQIMGDLTAHFPTEFGNYHELFAGGLSVFLELYNRGVLRDKRVFVSDAMMPLINTYDAVQTDVTGLCRELSSPAYACTPERFAANRTRFNETKEETGIEQAALFVYLNKTCFNGMYRENSRGEYNVPYGKRTAPVKTESMVPFSQALAGVTLSCGDFTSMARHMAPGDFVYLDPPYHGTFTGYTREGFGIDEQRRLKRFVDDLTAHGIHVVLSNSDTGFIRDLYKDYAIHEIPVKRPITCRSSDRNTVFTELVISNAQRLKDFEEP